VTNLPTQTLPEFVNDNFFSPIWQPVDCQTLARKRTRIFNGEKKSYQSLIANEMLAKIVQPHKISVTQALGTFFIEPNSP